MLGSLRWWEGLRGRVDGGNVGLVCPGLRRRTTHDEINPCLSIALLNLLIILLRSALVAAGLRAGRSRAEGQLLYQPLLDRLMSQ